MEQISSPTNDLLIFSSIQYPFFCNRPIHSLMFLLVTIGSPQSTKQSVNNDRDKYKDKVNDNIKVETKTAPNSSPGGQRG